MTWKVSGVPAARSEISGPSF